MMARVESVLKDTVTVLLQSKLTHLLHVQFNYTEKTEVNYSDNK